jgi:hypothetical protein
MPEMPVKVFSDLIENEHGSELCHLQFGQICSDAWTKKGVNDTHKMFNVCVNMPSGKSTFVKSVPTDGSEAITAEFIKKVLVESAEEVRSLPL